MLENSLKQRLGVLRRHSSVCVRLFGVLEVRLGLLFAILRTQCDLSESILVGSLSGDLS